MEEPQSSKSIPTDKSIICKGPCKKKTYASNLFLDHLENAKRCRIKYTADEISELQIASQLKVDVAPSKNQVCFSKTRIKVKAKKITIACAQDQPKKRIN